MITYEELKKHEKELEKTVNGLKEEARIERDIATSKSDALYHAINKLQNDRSKINDESNATQHKISEKIRAAEDKVGGERAEIMTAWKIASLKQLAPKKYVPGNAPYNTDKFTFDDGPAISLNPDNVWIQVIAYTEMTRKPTNAYGLRVKAVPNHVSQHVMKLSGFGNAWDVERGTKACVSVVVDKDFPSMDALKRYYERNVAKMAKPALEECARFAKMIEDSGTIDEVVDLRMISGNSYGEIGYDHRFKIKTAKQKELILADEPGFYTKGFKESRARITIENNEFIVEAETPEYRLSIVQTLDYTYELSSVNATKMALEEQIAKLKCKAKAKETISHAEEVEVEEIVPVPGAQPPVC